MKICPRCKIISGDTSDACDCGYDFRTGAVTRSQPQKREWLTGHECVAFGVGLILAGLALAFAGVTRAAPFIGWGAYLIVRGRRKQNVTTFVELERDPRPRILYLRPFDTDESVSGEKVRFFASAFSFVPTTPLQQLAVQFRKVGPFVCIGKPGDDLPHSGPTALYVPEQEWERAVQNAMAKSRFLVFLGAFNWNVVRELEWAIQTRGPEYILFWLPRGDRVDYREFREKAHAYLPKQTLPEHSPKHVRFIYFDRDWTPTLVTPHPIEFVIGLGRSAGLSLTGFFTQIGIDQGTQQHIGEVAVVLKVLTLVGAVLFLAILVLM